MNLVQDYYQQSHLDILKRVAESCTATTGSIMEIGCWQGQSATVITDVFKGKQLIAIDPWDDTHDPGATGAFERFRENMKGRDVLIHRRNWRDFFRDYKIPIAFLHIDAIHSYEEVKDNILAAIPLMVKGGIMCGHDLDNPAFPGVRQAIEETLPGFEFEEWVFWKKF